MQSSSIVFRVQDADYPDCRYYADLSVQVSVLLSAGDCKDSSRSIDSTTGKCICGTGRVEIGQACIGLGVLLAIVACLVVVFPLLALYIRAWHRAQKADAMWRIDATELKFDEPPVLIGQGGFSVVHMAEYRGTQVAVKKLNSAIHRRKDRFTAMEEGQPSSTQFTRTDSPRHSIRSRGYSVHDHSEASETRSSCVEFGVRSPPICFEADMRLLTSLRHPCLTTIMGALVTKKNEHLLVMEYMEHGTLWDLLHNETVDFEGDLVLSILSDITQGIQFLHNMKPQVIHGDIKSHNILIDTKMRAKLSNFGITYKPALKGTPQWMAPELIHNKNGNTMASDVYALGVVLYEIYARKEPYVDDDLFTVLQEVSDPSVNKRPETPTSMPPLVSALMHDCLLADPDERPTLDEIATRVRRFSPNDVEPIGLPKRHKAGEKNFELLLKVFPRHIAEALRDGREVPPEHHDSVTIFFSDIVGFTKIATELPPEKVSDLLHRLFYSFDTLAEAKGVFKVETIGDAWMGVTNCVKDQSDDQTKRIAEFALSAIEATSKILIDVDDPDRGCVRIRVGFHSGPVLSNVIGSHNPRYALFGDTVNTASRMESSSEPGRIHCSERSALLLRQQAPHLHTICRGTVQVKGKGKMVTYWVSESSSGAIQRQMKPREIFKSMMEEMESDDDSKA